MKRIICILSLILAFSCLATLMVGCKKEDETPEPVYGDYTISIVDGLNNPMSNVVVKFTYPDGTTKSRITEADGVASIKNVELGDYKVTLEKGFSNAIIDVASYNLTKDNTSLK
ncbi:MAG: Ig-like domain-containing protein, partial [Clostridia bacterium]|nr:Ig-like domain-containing protein [Clostridia bacterium]